MKMLSIALLGSALLISFAAAAKDTHEAQPASANQYYGLYQNPSHASGASDSGNFAHSGTRGREDLGAEDAHPEGPGNVTD